MQPFFVLAFLRFKRPGDKKFGDFLPHLIRAYGTGPEGLSLAAGEGLFDCLADGGAIHTGEVGEPHGFFKVVGFQLCHQHRHGRIVTINMRHREDAGAHFRGHTETGEVRRAEWVLGKPFIGDGHDAVIPVHRADPDAGEKGAGDLRKEEETKFEGVIEEAEEPGRCGKGFCGRMRLAGGWVA
jgi:hypothetical protein